MDRGSASLAGIHLRTNLHAHRRLTAGQAPSGYLAQPQREAQQVTRGRPCSSLVCYDVLGCRLFSSALTAMSQALDMLLLTSAAWASLSPHAILSMRSCLCFHLCGGCSFLEPWQHFSAWSPRHASQYDCLSFLRVCLFRTSPSPRRSVKSLRTSCLLKVQPDPSCDSSAATLTTPL